MKIKEIQRIINYKVGYQVRWELIDGTEFGSGDVLMKSAYNLDGTYIGDTKIAYRLCRDRGIMPEPRSGSKVCSIGFSKSQDKWYGWSHRAIYGFSIGDIVKEGDCTASSLSVGFIAKDFRDCKQMAIAFAESVS